MYPEKFVWNLGKNITIINLYNKSKIYHLQTKLTREIIEGNKYLSHTHPFSPVYQNATIWPIFVPSSEIEILLQCFYYWPRNIAIKWRHFY